MKTILTTCLVLTAMVGFSQAETFFKAVESQDMATIKSLLLDEVELCIKDDQSIMSNAEAIADIQAFLSKVKPKSVSSLHSGASGSGSKYKVAKLTSEAGTYRIFVYMEANKIHEVRFDDF